MDQDYVKLSLVTGIVRGSLDSQLGDNLFCVQAREQQFTLTPAFLKNLLVRARERGMTNAHFQEAFEIAGQYIDAEWLDGLKIEIGLNHTNH